VKSQCKSCGLAVFSREEIRRTLEELLDACTDGYGRNPHNALKLVRKELGEILPRVECAMCGPTATIQEAA